MKERLLEWLRCPATGGELRLAGYVAADGPDDDVEEGVLVSEAGHVYPVIDGVPRMIESALFFYGGFRERHGARLETAGLLGPVATAEPSREFREAIVPTLRRFEREWSSHDLEDTTWGLDQATRVEHFLRYVSLPREALPGKVVLDAGAGTGQLTCSYARLGCEVIGVDLQPAVVRGWKARRAFAPDDHERIHVVQGNLMQPPFAEGAFDVIHSSGVLHHTPDTRTAFDAVAPLTKPGGTLGVWLYRDTPDWRLPLVPAVNARWLSLSVRGLRKHTPRMNPSLLHALLTAYCAYFQAAFKLNQVLRGRPHTQTVKERTTSLFDTLAPPYAWRHTPEEVFGWFREHGYSDPHDTSLPDDDCGFNVTAVRG